MTTGREADLKRLGALIRAARAARGWTQTQAAEKSAEGDRRGIKRSSWMTVEAGKPAKPMTYRAIEYALNLEPGACTAVLEGADELTPSLTVTEVSAAMTQKGVVAFVASVGELDEVSLRAILNAVRGELTQREARDPEGNGAHAK